ncbi:putative RNA-directed DNA polymerase [Aphis craccivora]|uniref:Putative RNA-directed DNA polymerase n=1 Tax=Aphis craccivora TaxID=307492 RepID=A0A6G0VQP2_APHCR|nr:putative RNA-directed DNA polymerase [Aphis craccivora]
MMFLFDLLNDNIDFSKLLSQVGFNFRNNGTRSRNLFVVPFYNTNCSSESFFPRVLTLANKIINQVDFLFMSSHVFKRNVYITLSSVNYL